jgi:hypothetical protein
MVIILATAVVIATVVLINTVRSITKTYTQPAYSSRPEVPEQDRTIPDMPDGFGFKCNWFAIRSENAVQIAEVMNLQHLDPCNWAVGIAKAYEGEIFITPVIDGWTMVLGWGLPSADTADGIEEVKRILLQLSNEFGEAQYFITHRITDYHLWMKAISGSITRIYGISEMENVMVEGTPTEIEAGLNLINATFENAKEKEFFLSTNTINAGEQTLMDIAGNWSVDPSILFERKDLKPGLGYLAAYDFYY